MSTAHRRASRGRRRDSPTAIKGPAEGRRSERSRERASGRVQDNPPRAGDLTDDPGDAETGQFAGVVLPLAEEDVAVVEPPGQLTDGHDAETALALAAIPHELGAGRGEGVEHGLPGGDGRGDAEL